MNDEQLKLQRVAAELDELKAAFADQKARWEEERAQMAAQLHTQTAVMGSRDDSQSEQQDWEEPANEEASGLEAESDSATNSATPPQESDDDIFARLRAMSLLKDKAQDSPSDEPAASTEEQDESPVEEEPVIDEAAAEAPSESAPQQPAEANHEEESINDYMSRLLAKYGGKPGDAAASQQYTPSAAETRNAAEAKARTPEVVIEQPKPEAPRQPVLTKLEARTAAPEKSVDLAAMREIANFTSRTAIAKHHDRLSILRVWGTVGVAFIGLLCGTLLLHWDTSDQSWVFFGGLAGLIISGYWFVRAGHLARGLKKFRRKTENSMVNGASGPAQVTLERADQSNVEKGK